jgi:Ala-tRNA(Pro) deacylase
VYGKKEITMAIRRTLEFLDGESVKYVVMHHSAAYTAQEVAASAHIPGKCMAKTVIVDIDGSLALAVVPADRDVEMGMLRTAARAQSVALADPSQFADRFEGCQLGMEPPLGNLFGMETYVDKGMTKQDWIAFNAGSHTDVIEMAFNDYLRVAHPKVVKISVAAIPGFSARRVSQL